MGFRGHLTFRIDKRGVMNVSYSCPWSGGGKSPLIFMTDMIRCFSTSAPHPRDCALKPFCSWKPGHLLPSCKKVRACIVSHQNRYYQSSTGKGLSFWNYDFIYVSSHQYWGVLSNISEKAHTVSAGWLDESPTLETWLLSNNLISQMEKQHLFSRSFTYGDHCC